MGLKDYNNRNIYIPITERNVKQIAAELKTIESFRNLDIESIFERKSIEFSINFSKDRVEWCESSWYESRDWTRIEYGNIEPIKDEIIEF